MKRKSKYFLKINELLTFLNLKDSADYDQNPDYPMQVPVSYALKMEKGNPLDPLFLQVVPRLQERKNKKGYSEDPVGDKDSTCLDGILQKYKGRILLICGNACSVKCRFCFRRNEKCLTTPNLEKNLVSFFKEKRNVEEIIFSGGDPFLYPLEKLDTILKILGPIAEVQTIRFHSRVPVTEPERAKDLLPLIEKYKSRFRFVLVIHANHANELRGKTPEILKEFLNEEVLLLNQSTLLKGINDNSKTLKELSLALFKSHVLPYYLHVLDHAKGTSHFEISDKKAIQIHNELKAMLPGYLVPKLVREIPKEKSKTAVY